MQIKSIKNIKIINHTPSFSYSKNAANIKLAFKNGVSTMQQSPFAVSKINYRDLTFVADNCVYNVYVDLNDNRIFMGHKEFVEDMYS